VPITVRRNSWTHKTLREKRSEYVLCEFERLSKRGKLRVCYRRARFSITIVESFKETKHPICGKCMRLRGCSPDERIVVDEYDDDLGT